MPNELNEKQLMLARNESQLYLANISSKSALKLNTSLAFFEKNFNTSFEELGCVGYNPDSEELTAIVKIKRAYGYSGNLCSAGSHIYVRFYVNYGGGWVDEGYVGANVHDIPDSKDCDQQLEKPMEFALRLKIDPKQKVCSQPVLPKVKAVLLWNSIPPANDPNLTQPGYVWGNVKEDQIQIKPIKINIPFVNIGSLIEKAILNPAISLKDLTANNPAAAKSLSDAQKEYAADKVNFSQLVSDYKKANLSVEPHRSGAKLLVEAMTSNDPVIKSNIVSLFKANQLDFTKSLQDLIKSTGNTTYEEIGCVGLDYHKEAFVATFRAKKNYGYGGGLCTAGSKEYVTFWIKDSSTNCQWVRVGTQVVVLHDIPGHAGLSYSAILPHDLTKFKTKCDAPRVIKVRAVLSWNVPPTGLDTPYWGNFKEAYVQIPPMPKGWNGKSPKMILLGGISVDHIDDTTGLTLPAAKFEINQNPVINGSRFMGKISIHGVSSPFAGMKYRIKVINLETGAMNYVNDPLHLVGYDSSGNVIHTTINPEPATNYYTYQPYQLNIMSQLALFSPGTNARLNIVIEHEDGSSDSHRIQMDNTYPVPMMKINDEGECVHFKKGDVILGKFSATDNFIHKFTLSVSGGRFTDMDFEGVNQVIAPGEVNSFTRTVNVVNGEFKVTTATDKNCGNIVLVIEQKNVVDSAYMASPTYTNQAFCLKD